jgi:hypothetical protein
MNDALDILAHAMHRAMHDKAGLVNGIWRRYDFVAIEIDLQKV